VDRGNAVSCGVDGNYRKCFAVDNILGVQLFLELLVGAGLGVILAVFTWLTFDGDGI
jgi:hypothetical protein